VYTPIEWNTAIQRPFTSFCRKLELGSPFKIEFHLCALSPLQVVSPHNASCCWLVAFYVAEREAGTQDHRLPGHATRRPPLKGSKPLRRRGNRETRPNFGVRVSLLTSPLLNTYLHATLPYGPMRVLVGLGFNNLGIPLTDRLWGGSKRQYGMLTLSGLSFASGQTYIYERRDQLLLPPNPFHELTEAMIWRVS
jgi:hypothetical protein